MIINQCPEKRGEGGTSKIPVGQDNNKEGGGRGGVERGRERWYLVYNGNSIWDQSILIKGLEITRGRRGVLERVRGGEAVYLTVHYRVY